MVEIPTHHISPECIAMEAFCNRYLYQPITGDASQFRGHVWQPTGEDCNSLRERWAIINVCVIPTQGDRNCKICAFIQNKSDNLLVWVMRHGYLCYTYRIFWLNSMRPGNTYIYLNTLRPRQNGRHFADDIFNGIFFNENVWILIKISLKFVPKGPINNIPAWVQMMAWRWPGNKPLSETMMVRLKTHICITRPQWVNSLTPGRCSSNFKTVISEHVCYVHFLSISLQMNSTKHFRQ